MSMGPQASNDNSTVYTSSTVGKGKARAKSPDATERTPLLSSVSSSSTVGSDERGLRSSPLPIPLQQRIIRRLLIVFSITFAICVVLVTLVVFIAYSYSSRASSIATDDILKRGLVFQGPNAVEVLNVTDSGDIWVRVDGHVGVDAGELLGVNSADEDMAFRRIWKALGRWGVSQLGDISICLSPIEIRSQKNWATVLATFQTQPFQLTVKTNPPDDLSWLTKVSLPVLISSTKNSSALVHFAQDSWAAGMMNVTTSVASITVRGGGIFEHSWRDNFHLERKDIQTVLQVKIPALPGLPSPGTDVPFPSLSDFITLKTFSLYSDLDEVLIKASATCIDPLPRSLNFTAPSLSFIVSIPSSNDTTTRELFPIADVTTSPFTLTHPNITVGMTGHVPPLASDASSALSLFLTSYLSAHSPDISVSSPSFPNITFDTVFPAPHPKPQILRNVTIKDMKVKPSTSGTIVASGVVFAAAVLPKGMNIALHVGRVFPELLVFDGPVPSASVSNALDDGEDGDEDDDDTSLPEPMPLPDPLPERAFAHIRPDTWLDALSVPINPPEGEGSAVAVSAKFEDVLLQVLPGRQREFSNFVGKIVFGNEGALAGISGTVSVGVRVQGLSIGDDRDEQFGEMLLHGLPFRSNVRVGKK